MLQYNNIIIIIINLLSKKWEAINKIQIGLRIGSDLTGILAFGAEELFWEKLFLIMTQVARNKKSEFSKQQSNPWLVQSPLD